MTKVFIIDRRQPWKPITEMETTIFTAKRAWVKINGVVRYMVGSTAFFTKAGAQAARIGNCVKVAENDYQKFYYRWRYDNAVRFLEENGVTLTQLAKPPKRKHNGKSR